MSKKSAVSIGELNNNFLAVALLACLAFAVGIFAKYSDTGYVSSIAPPEADSVGIPIMGGMYIVALLLPIALVFYFTIRRQNAAGMVDYWLLFGRIKGVRLNIFRWLALVLCVAMLGLAVAWFENVNIFTNLAYVLFFGLGIMATLHFFIIWIGLAQLKKAKKEKVPIAAKDIFLRAGRIFLAVVACLAYIYLIAPIVALGLFCLMMPIGEFFYH